MTTISSRRFKHASATLCSSLSQATFIYAVILEDVTFTNYSKEYVAFVYVLFFAISLMLSRHTRDHPLRRLWTGLFINHVRGVKGGP